MKSNNPNSSGILFTLAFIGLFFVSLIVILVADVEIGSFLEGQVNGAINSQVDSKIGSVAATAASGGNVNNSLFYEFGN
jgi:hypothetical protein